jgi:LAO/AO transport system kinase
VAFVTYYENPNLFTHPKPISVTPIVVVMSIDVSEQRVSDLAKAVRRGERRALAKAITLIESTRPDDRESALELIDSMIQETGQSIRIGISGTPGVGKSTFIEAFGMKLVELGLRVAVLAVDPSSTRHGGSILGDKTRMPTLAVHPSAYIRPSPSGGTLGGVARRTREAMLLCEAAGFDVVLVETVGVGQSETAVANLTDVFVLLMAPAGGDELQGVKRGIMELADLLVVNKADGPLLPIANATLSDYSSALGLLRPRTTAWSPRSMAISSLTGTGIDTLWEAVEEYCSVMRASGHWETRRAEQSSSWLWDELQERVLAAFRADRRVAAELTAAEVRSGRRNPGAAAAQIISAYTDRLPG